MLELLFFSDKKSFENAILRIKIKIINYSFLQKETGIIQWTTHRELGEQDQFDGRFPTVKSPNPENFPYTGT